MLLLHQKAAEDEGVHAGTKKGAEGIGGRVHDGFAAKIEGGVHDHGHAGALAEFIDEAVVERVNFLFDRLGTGAAVDVGDRRDDTALFRAHLRGEDHER